MTDARSLTSRSSLLALAFLFAVGLVIPLLIGAALGSVFLPSNDDPSYRRVANELYANGRLQLNGWNSMTLVGEIFFVQPFLWLSRGADWAFTASTAVFTGLGIVAGYSLARRVLNAWASTFCVLGLFIFPGFLLNTTNFMTDVPSWALSLTCLSLAVAAFSATGSRRWVWLLAALAVGCFAFSIRETAIMAIVAVLAVGALRPIGRRPGFWIAGVATLAVCVGIYYFATHLPGRANGQLGDIGLDVDTVGRTFTIYVSRGVASVCFVTSPALVIAAARRWRTWHLPDMLVGVAVSAVFVIGVVAQAATTGHFPQALAGNLTSSVGPLGMAPIYGTRPQLWSTEVWAGINALALLTVLFAGAVCGGAIGRFLRTLSTGRRAGAGRAALLDRIRPWTDPTWGLVVAFAVIYAAGITFWSMIGLSFFDRYTWPLILPLYAILLRPVQAEAGAPLAAAGHEAGAAAAPAVPARLARWTAPALAAVLVACLVGVSLSIVTSYDSFSTGRWNVGTSLTNAGMPAKHVDAGFEWVTFHADGPMGWTEVVVGKRYDNWWPSVRACALVSTTPVTSDKATLLRVDTRAYRLFGFAGPWEPLYVYTIADPACS